MDCFCCMLRHILRIARRYVFFLWRGYSIYISGNLHVYMCINAHTKNHHHHHHVAPPTWISLTLSRHPSQSSIASGRSSRLHPVSVQSCCMYALDGHPAFARPCEGVHRSTSLTRSSLLLQQCPACLVRLTLIVFEMGGKWQYSCCFVGCCLQDLFNIARSILM